jgi:putative mRNA 3-end processing factor
LEKLRQLIKLGQTAKLKSCSVQFFNAGHVPGSAALLYESQGKRILYTGDIKFVDSVLMKKAHTDYKDIDLLITETTYSYKNHPDRVELADKLREMIQHTIYNNGTVLLPSFAVGRTQEMLCLTYDLGFPLYLDGMGIEATKRILMHPESVRSPKKLKHAFKKARKIYKFKDRPKVLKQPCIVICTAGMLQGGPISYYISQLHDREDCTLILTGYQVEGTVGRTLFDTGRYRYEDIDVKPRMKMESLDFSAHCGRDNLISFIEKVNPGKVAMVHGERTAEFAREMKQKGFDAIAPKNGDMLKL